MKKLLYQKLEAKYYASYRVNIIMSKKIMKLNAGLYPLGTKPSTGNLM
jgi:hypothetical protein